MTINIKLYGLQRTGTNYCLNVLCENFERTARVLDNGLGWKHGPVVDPEAWLKRHDKHLSELRGETRRVCVLMLTKNPLAWFVSFARYYDFLGEWERHQQLVRCTMNNYAAIQRNWLDVMSHFYDTIRLVRFEDLLVEYQTTMHGIAKQFSLPVKKTHVFENIDNEVRPTGATENPFNAHRVYYAQQRYKEHIPPELEALILDSVSDDLLEQLGYTPAGEVKGPARA